VWYGELGKGICVGCNFGGVREVGWFSSELWSDEEDVEEEGVKGEECNESLAANTVWGAFTTTSTSDKSNEEEGGGGFKLLP